MEAFTTLGVYLRAERERRGLTLRAISENTKVSVPLLEGLEADDISRWPGGIFRRAFVRAYAEAVGLDPDAVFRRFEQQHKLATPDPQSHDTGLASPEAQLVAQSGSHRGSAGRTGTSFPLRARYLGTAADLTVAVVLAFGSAAAGSRLLWPVLMIAAYYAAGILLTGTSPMVALLSQTESTPARPATDANDADADNTDSLLTHSSARTIS
jgi:transcriptional regulator with XRE-family HTH domain